MYAWVNGVDMRTCSTKGSTDDLGAVVIVWHSRYQLFLYIAMKMTAGLLDCKSSVTC